MFFKMLRNDLRAHKGLNIILFIFIISASIISVIAANLLVANVTGRSATDKLTNAANMYINCNVGMDDFENKKDLVSDWMKNNELIIDSEVTDYAHLTDDEIVVNGTYASDRAFPAHNPFHLTTATRRLNLLYNDDDKPFAVDTGCVAVSIDIADMAGIRRGDRIRITTQMGKIFEFTVSEIYKTPGISNSENLIISDADFEYLKDEFPFRVFRLYINSKSVNYSKKITGAMLDDGLFESYSAWTYTPEMDMNYTIITVITYFLVFMSIVIIFIMLITVRFMMVAAIKQEEKEIGMMRAIGVDSPKYRWMFAATYITFAAVGGIAGFLAGVPLSKKVIRQFCKNFIFLDHNMTTYISIAVSVMMVIMIILFAAVMMRRINRISIIETIHGNSAGERFTRFNRLNMYRSKRLKVPSFLAIGNIVNSFRKYVFLIISYMIAVVIMFMIFDLKSTLLSKEYARSFLQLRYDFTFYLCDDIGEYYYQKGGDMVGAYKYMIEDAKKAGIPIGFRYMNYSNVNIVQADGEELSAKFLYGDTNNEGIRLRKGSRLPILKNEVIVSYFTAKKQNMKIGDTISLKIDEYNDDKIGYHSVNRDFIITGFFDMMEEGYPAIIAGMMYTGAYRNGTNITDLYFDAPKSQHKELMKKLEDLFTEDVAVSMERNSKYNFAYITGYIDALKIILSVMIAFILSLITLLFTTVDLAGETSSVAMLKCVGFSNKDVRWWQMQRMLIIIVLAIIIGVIVEKTAGSWIVEKIIGNFGNTGFRFISDPVDLFLIIPLLIFSIVIIALRLCLRRVKGINIQNIRED